ncbi:MAG: glycoside hydrolase family 172 protein [Planctomycetota bacterium]|jgi:hypothetical protein
MRLLIFLPIYLVLLSADTVAQSFDPVLAPQKALYDLRYPLLIPKTVQAGYLSSHDRMGANDDGFVGTYSALYKLDNGEYVIVDLYGPGCLYTLWFTGPDGGRDLQWGRLRFYLDNQTKPCLEAYNRELFSGDMLGFPRPLIADSNISTGGNVCYLPIPFQKRLIITTEKRALFYNAYYHLYPAGTRIKSWTGKEDLNFAIKAWNATGSNPYKSPAQKWFRGQIKVRALRKGVKPKPQEIVHLQGSGVVNVLRLNPDRALAASVLNNLWLRIWWDGEDNPSVGTPIGPFFGSGQGEASVRALPIGMSPSGSYYCYLPMPFDKQARIVLENRQEKKVGEIYYEVGITERKDGFSLQTAGKFRTVYRKDRPKQNKYYTILREPTGQGTYLGQCLIVDPFKEDNVSWWEGDMRIWLDQRRHPMLQGTGHEDEYLGGWSTRWLQGPYSLPMHGLPCTRLFPRGTQRKVTGAMTAYRFFIGGIPFRNGITVATEHGTENKVVTNYASVAYYYYKDEAGMTLSDSIDIGKQESEQEHQYQTTGSKEIIEDSSLFEAAENGRASVPVTENGRCGQLNESFVIRIDPDNQGILLRRLFSQSVGRHHAKVQVDGRFAGTYHMPENYRINRWAEMDLILPPILTAGKDKITIQINCTLGTWNSYGYWVYSLTE